MDIELYNKINNSYKKTLFFHFGAGAGFFSEYNNMLRAIAYCLIHKIKFVLYSKDAGFRRQNGWQDYFKPFCEESLLDLNSEYNYRFTDFMVTSNFMLFVKSAILSVVRNDRSLIRFYYLFKTPNKVIWLKFKHGITYFTYDLWYDIRGLKDTSNINIAHSDSKCVGDLIHEIDNMIWVFNDTMKSLESIVLQDLFLKHGVKNHNKSQVTLLNLKSSDNVEEVSFFGGDINRPSYVYGVHIRGGDKFVETKLLDCEFYINKLKELGYDDYSDLFVLTDDYRVIENLQFLLPNANILTLCTLEQKGYFNDDFYTMNRDSVFKQIANLLISVNILSKCIFFIGTYSSNPSLCVAIKRRFVNSVSLD